MAQRRLTHAFLKEQKERKERKSERVKEQKSERAERAKKRKSKRAKEQKSERAKELNKERAKEWKRERANSQPWYLTTELTHKYCFGPLMDMLRRFPKRLGLGWDTLLESLNILSLTIRILRVLLIITLKGTRGDGHGLWCHWHHKSWLRCVIDTAARVWPMGAMRAVELDFAMSL